jgi:hypothetical protein
VGKLEIYLGPTFEENQLMLAEANIRTGNIPAGLLLIDAVRTYQGAGVAALGSLNFAQALKELTMERLAASLFVDFLSMIFADGVGHMLLQRRRKVWNYITLSK